MPAPFSTAPPGLLTFEPLLKRKVWGGDALARWGCHAPRGAQIGEAWLLADLASTSPSGGGGDAAISVVTRGAHRGATIHDILRQFPRDLLGPTADAVAFPLLVKLLDAHERLSVQTHPSPAYARRHRDAHLKTETWFVLEAAPDAAIYAGLADGVDPADLPAAALEDRLEPLLRRVPVRAGDCVHLPSGTLHALGAGVVVAEVQTPSDTTFRLHDWGRTERELHVEQTMACLDQSLRPEPTRPPEDPSGRWRLVDTPAYSIDLVRSGTHAGATTIDLDDRAAGVLCIGGGASVRAEGELVQLAPGGFALAPARLGAIKVHAGAALVVRIGAGS